MTDSIVAVERTVPAPAQAIFDLLADPEQHPLLDGSGSVRASREGNPERLSLGAKFGVDMRIWLPYRVTNKVVEFEEGRRIAWRHSGGHRWRYTLTPADDGTTLVREEWDPSRLPTITQRIHAMLGTPDRNRRGMEQTLDRLVERFS